MFLKRRCLKVEISKYLVKTAGTQYVLNIVCVCVCVCVRAHAHVCVCGHSVMSDSLQPHGRL